MKKQIFYTYILFIIFSVCVFVCTTEGSAIRSSETVSGDLETASTTDSWVFYGETGDRIVIASTKISGTMTGTYLRLYPPDGSAAESAGLGALGIDHQLQKTGLYTVTVEAHAHFGTGTYDLTLLKIPGPASCPDDQDGGAIFPSQTISGAIDSPSDLDAFQFYGQAGDRVLIDSAKASGTMTGTYLRLYPPDGSAEESAGLGALGLDRQLQKTGLYTIMVESHTHFGTGGYDVSLTKIPFDIRTGIYNPIPQDKSVVNVCGSSLVWDHVPGATGYDVFFGENVDEPLADVAENVLASSVIMPAIQKDEMYYWHVIAHRQDGDIPGPYWWFKAGETCNMLTINKTGNGSCFITSNPSGINCGDTCSLSYDAGTNITLTVTPDDNSIFAGWGGDADCADGQVGLDDHKNCVAICNLKAPTPDPSPTPTPQGNPIISASPVSVNFGNVAADTTSAPRTVTVKNTGTSDLIISSITISGANPFEFNQINDCTMIASGSSCSINVTFNPATPFGKRSATMSIFSNDLKKSTVTCARQELMIKN